MLRVLQVRGKEESVSQTDDECVNVLSSALPPLRLLTRETDSQLNSGAVPQTSWCCVLGWLAVTSWRGGRKGAVADPSVFRPQARLNCKHCGKPVIDVRIGMQYFSEYSNVQQCPHCGNLDYHFVKPFSSFKVLEAY